MHQQPPHAPLGPNSFSTIGQSRRVNGRMETLSGWRRFLVLVSLFRATIYLSVAIISLLLSLQPAPIATKYDTHGGFRQQFASNGQLRLRREAPAKRRRRRAVSVRLEFLITPGRVSSGQQTGCFLNVDALHQYPFPPIR